MRAKLLRGDRLTADQRRQVLAAFVYRWTSENGQRGAAYGRCPVCGEHGGKPDDPATAYVAPVACRQHHPTIPLVSDSRWIQDHAFYFTAAGKLAERPRYCEPFYLAR
ncbi:MAG TPA: hypothetical protein PLF81_22430 [Candidatus Anammoximicrobium sp.]|nr:hypothetical protein [Candidatus Anammoximicrobium sp.]